MLEEDQQTEEIIECVAALDIGKAEVMACVRVPRPGVPGRRLQKVKAYSTMTRSLCRLADRFSELGVTRVVMEATSVIGNRCTTCWRRTDSKPGWSTPAT